ncbi:uncharacterized protein VTP21DRAFT_2070 [Calcarisporiella thermophila]|uniref:uncharacterized protein n=1 Tax=Calcarisporiella thermophila TaxID=911321 RepID=UPI003743C715
MSLAIDTKEYLFKVLVLGDLGTGKTSVIKRYVHDIFSMHYKSTIGVDFALKTLQWDQDTMVRLQLWDIAGQERFGNMTRVYYKEALGALIVYDVTRHGTFEGVARWKNDLDQKVSLPELWGGGPIPAVLLANKSDLLKNDMHTDEALEKFCSEHHFLKCFPTSAKENKNIKEAVHCLVEAILQIASRYEGVVYPHEHDNIRLGQEKEQGGACC